MQKPLKGKTTHPVQMQVPQVDFNFLQKKAQEAGIPHSTFAWTLVKKALNELKKAA